MKRLCTRLFVALASVALLQLPGVAAAHVNFLGPGLSGCAFEDVNDNGIFDNGTDVPVADAQWLGGTAFVSNNPFVVPVGCEHTLSVVLSPVFGVKVTATKITFLGKLDYLPAGGRGVVLIADPAQVPAPALGNGDFIMGNGVAADVVISAGGANLLATTTPAVPGKSVALWATGTCTFNQAQVLGNHPLQNTKVGILCTDDITFRNTFVVGSKVNIQSLTGKIDGRSSAPPAGPTLADLCDDPATNLVGGGAAPGNGNGVSDAGDFPCQLDLSGLGVQNFADATALANFCQPSVGGVNKFHAFNDPLIMIAGAGAGLDLDLRGAASGRTSVVGRYRVTLVAEDGNVLTNFADIDQGEQLGLTPPGGAKIWVFADPTSVNRLPVDHEDVFGPSAGTTTVDSACYQSPSPVQVGRDGGGLIHVTGVTNPPPCLQNPGGFVPVLNGNF
jgi:hypothetical protein